MKKVDSNTFLVIASLAVVLLGLVSYFFSMRNPARKADLDQEIQKLSRPVK